MTNKEKENLFEERSKITLLMALEEIDEEVILLGTMQSKPQSGQVILWYKPSSVKLMSLINVN